LTPLFDPLVLGQRIRHHRRRRGLTLDDLGEKVGRPAPYLSLVENGRREPKLSLVSDIANALDVTVADLLDPTPPSQRAALEVELRRIHEDPRFRRLSLPHLKPSARVPDAALAQIVGLFRALVEDGDETTELRRAHGRVTRRLAESDGRLPEVERVAAAALQRAGYSGAGPLTARNLIDLVAGYGYRIDAVEALPPGVRSVLDRRRRVLLIPQRNELRTRQARKAVLQTIGSIALEHSEAADVETWLTQRVETAYFAAAVLVPERAAVPFLLAARGDRDLSVEDLKERFYVSYEMAAQRFCNLATHHLGLRTHVIRSDPAGMVIKAYANDGIPLPTDPFGSAEGQFLCRRWGARAAYRSEDRFSLHHQYTETPVGAFWCATHIQADSDAHAVTVGVPADDARLFRGRETAHRQRSSCPEGACCRPSTSQHARWDGQVSVGSRAQDRIVGLLASDPRPRVDWVEILDLLDDHDPPS